MARWNGRSRKQNKKTRDGYEPIEICTKCQADIFFSHEIKKFLEPRTRFWHSDLRCKTIIQSKKTDQQNKNAKVLRREVIQELKSEIASFAEGTTMLEIFYEIIKRRKVEIDKVSKKEIAVSFFPHDTYRSITGDLEPTPKGLQNAESLLQRLKKHPKNMTTLVYSKKFENGEWYYYNLQTKEQYRPVEERLIKMKDGLVQTIKKNRQIVESGEKVRKEAEEAFRKALQEYNNRRKKKRWP